MREVAISTEYITLGQVLKLADVVGSGGEVKAFLQEASVKVNGEPENRRGRKLVPGDTVDVTGFGTIVVKAR
ncbi:S4 domain-containing protein YaaA [Cohnella lubricantis]|uniref:S4 domain-containing protein YaaA n=1 Tax=Cohnella lubricantis TaxID=2163172 RepID=A0A841TG54_9BACL|nr:S4 domain-containing protein YaaA [Cohnella lubricantis]MBB6678248.1 S4 domain-containing protein YaaA [Cohnella lubricantis]MBP2120102.1 S4 domain protein YaaA [Cohnella lubricantis]